MRWIVGLFGVFGICICMNSVSGALVSYNSGFPGQNESARNGWLAATGISAPEYRVDFETGFSDGQNVSGQTALFPGRLLIRDTSARNQALVKSGPGSISLSNPVGNSALSWEGNLFEYLELDFSGAPVDYVAWQDIDTTSNNSLISIYYVDGSYTNFRPDDTYTTGDSAEFLGFFRSDLPEIQKVRLNLSGDMYGIDNIEYGNVPEVVQLAGDFNGDGTVDAGDYTLWRKNTAAADGSDVATSAGDYDVWRSNFGESLSSGKMSVSSGLTAMVVPEPATWVLLLGAIGVVVAWRRLSYAGGRCGRSVSG
jgi:hypothetical protein